MGHIFFLIVRQRLGKKITCDIILIILLLLGILDYFTWKYEHKKIYILKSIFINVYLLPPTCKNNLIIPV